jgi:hypothetical protein
MLAVMARLIARRFPEVTTLISYQDVETHDGTIYKAAGWDAVSVHKGGSWDRPNARNTYNGKPRIRLDLNKATGEKVRWQRQLGKSPKEQ